MESESDIETNNRGECQAGDLNKPINMEAHSSSNAEKNVEMENESSSSQIETFFDEQEIETDDITFTTNPVIEESKRKIKRLINVKALCRHAQTYKLKYFSKNLLIIFNNFDVKGYLPRIGTDIDVAALTETFEPFRFEVEVHNDRTREQIMTILKAYSEINFTDYGCIAIAVLTHGVDNLLLGSDGESYSVTDIINYFDATNNPTLVTKPRILMIQVWFIWAGEVYCSHGTTSIYCACRGEEPVDSIPVRVSLLQPDNNDQDQGIPVVRTDGNTRNPTRNKQPREELENVLYTLSKHADFLLFQSCSEGERAYRETHGTWFIQTTCEKINEMADTHEIFDIFKQVLRKIALEMDYVDINVGRARLETYKQTPVLQTSLIREFYFEHYDGKPSLQDQLHQVECLCGFSKLYLSIAEEISRIKVTLSTMPDGLFEENISDLYLEMKEIEEVHQNLLTTTAYWVRSINKNMVKSLLDWFHQIEAELRGVPYKRQTSGTPVALSVIRQQLEQKMDEVNRLFKNCLGDLETTLTSLLLC